MSSPLLLTTKYWVTSATSQPAYSVPACFNALFCANTGTTMPSYLRTRGAAWMYGVVWVPYVSGNCGLFDVYESPSAVRRKIPQRCCSYSRNQSPDTITKPTQRSLKNRCQFTAKHEESLHFSSWFCPSLKLALDTNRSWLICAFNGSTSQNVMKSWFGWFRSGLDFVSGSMNLNSVLGCRLMACARWITWYSLSQIATFKKKAFWFTSYNLEAEIRQVKMIFHLKIAQIIITGPGT